MRRTVLVAVVLAMNLEDSGRPVAHAATISTAAPRSTEIPSSTRDEQAIAPGSRTAPDRPGPVPPPDLRGFPTATAPNELATVWLPDNFSDVTALFDRLPPEVAGHTRSPQFDHISPERSIVGYGEERRIAGTGGALLWITAIDVSARGGFFPPNWTGGQVIAVMARGKEAQDAGRDGDLFWTRNETFLETPGSAERLPVYGTLWGRVDSPWIFSIQADDRENRDALLAAFVTAAKSSPR